MKYAKEKKGINRNCPVCNRLFYIEPYQVLSGRKKFCSKPCLYKSGIQTKLFQKGHPDLVPASSRGHSKETRLNMSGENNHRWKGGISDFLESRGRREARRIVSQFFGRKLKPKEVIHHIDENTDNNDITNLFYFRLTGVHTKWHNTLRRYGRKGILKSNLELYA